MSRPSISYAPRRRESRSFSVVSQLSSAPVKFFTHEHSFRHRLQRVFVRNSNSRLLSTIFDLVVRVLACCLYLTRVLLDQPEDYACKGNPCGNVTNSSVIYELPEGDINWYVILWVHRPFSLWIAQVIVGIVTLIKMLLHVYVTFKNNPLAQVIHSSILLEMACIVPLLVTLCFPTKLQHLFVPSFLYCWLGKKSLERMFNDLHLTRQRFQTISVTLWQQLLILTATLFCLIFTTVCGIQHLQRGSSTSHLSLFESTYFVIVTFSTVGYGDISPDVWPSQLFMIIMICVAFAFIPRQLEIIGSTLIARQKEGGTYSKQYISKAKHVVVCSTVLSAESVMDFLNEFYAHPKLEDHMVILLCPRELDNNMNMILKGLKWAHRVIYIRGSALKDGDLKRCRIQEAGACFILPARSCMDRHTADHHTILRSWAVKDFSPHCPQYIHLFKAENKMHVKFAEHVICEDEFKYALLANNCLYPGLSTLVTILLHTSRGQEGELASERWQQIYGRHSGNEIYHIRLEDSVFFSRYDGMRFTDASADAHRRLGVGLVAVMDGEALHSQLLLNPGPEYILKDSDTCYYMSVTKEEYSEVVKDTADTTTVRVPPKGSASMAMELQNLVPDEDDSDDDHECLYISPRPSAVTFAVQDTIQEESEAEVNGLDNNFLKPMLTRKLSDRRESKILEMYSDMGQEEIISGIPPVTLYLGAKQIVCHLVRTKRPHCCLKWGPNCVHCRYKNATDDRWDQQLIILTAEYASKGIYNFIVPLRSHYLNKNLLSPIILMLEQEPDSLFLEFIAHFPLVYWMKGKITNVDDLITAGINKADNIVIVNRELDNGGNEETLCDSQTIVAVQTLLKLFPNASIMTELSQASNMRFMHFRAHDEYTYKISKLERKIKENIGSNLSFMFRLPFAAGRVFSASMLDSLLYQTYVKDYLITFVHLLLGIDHAEKSGHLSSIRIKRSTLARFPSYEDLYVGLSSTTGEIPIAIYRSERQFSSDNLNEELHNNNKPNKPIFKRSWSENYSDQQEVTNLVRKRLESLQFDPQNYCECNKNRNLVSFIILNPSPRRRLKQNDTVYVIQPSSMCAKPPNVHNQSRRRTATASFAKAKTTDE